jgi:hypothetical protein
MYLASIETPNHVLDAARGHLQGCKYLLNRGLLQLHDQCGGECAAAAQYLVVEDQALRG